MDEKIKHGNALIVLFFLIALSVVMVFSSVIVEKIGSRINLTSVKNSVLPNENMSFEIRLPLFPGNGNKQAAANQLDYDSMFLKDSYLINKPFTTAFFETKLIRVGFYKFFNDTSNSYKDIFRADISVKNTENEPHIFYASEGNVWYNWDNFSATGGNFSGVSVDPHEERVAYVLYGTVPRSISGFATITIGTTRAYSNLFQDFEVVPYSYNVSLPLLARPRSVLG